MVDTHCHLTHAKFRDDVDAVIARAREAGLERCVSIGTGVEDAARALDLARRHQGFLACTAGLDPFSAHAAGDAFDDHLARLAAQLRSGEFAAVGEVGLDYHYDLDPRPVQAERFRRQLELARELELPVVIHVREAHDDLAALLREHAGNRGVIHSFTAGPREAERYLERWPADLSTYFTALTLRYFDGSGNVNIVMLRDTSANLTEASAPTIYSGGLVVNVSEDTVGTIPRAFVLYQNYPNPFNQRRQ